MKKALTLAMVALSLALYLLHSRARAIESRIADMDASIKSHQLLIDNLNVRTKLLAERVKGAKIVFGVED